MRLYFSRRLVHIGPFTWCWNIYNSGPPHFVRSHPWGSKPRYVYSLYWGKLYLGVQGRVES